MRNLIKKSLAFLLVAALALTCFVGTLTVSAENPTATITITADAVEAGATEIPVTLTVESEVGINEALIKVSSDLGTIAEKATLVASDAAAEIDYAGEATDFGAFYLSALAPEGTENTELGEVTYAEIKVVFTNAGIAVGTYNVDVEVPADKVIAASKDEVAIDLVCEGLEIVVAEVVTECTHTYDTTDNVNFVDFDATGIKNYEVCTTCGESVEISTDSSESAVVVAEKANAQAYNVAINVTAGGTYTIPVDAEQAANLRYAYVKGDRLIANGYHSSLNDADLTNGNNAFVATYADGVVTVTTDFAGVFVAFVPANVTKLPTANIGISQAFNLGSSIAFNFMVNKTNLGNFEKVYAVINHKLFEGNTPLDVEDQIIDEYSISGVYYLFSYPISARQMGDNVTATYYGVLDGVDYTLRQKVDYSLVAYAASNVGYNGSDNALKTLLSTMFAYGATAQKAFVYRTDALVTENADIANYLEQYPAANTVSKDDISFTKGVTKHLDDNAKKFGVSKGLNCVSTVEVYFRMNAKNFIAAYGADELENITFKVYYKVGSKTETEVEYTYEEFGINDAYDYQSTSGNEYYFFKADKITASMMPSMTKIEAIYNGDILVSSDYSINEYLSANYDSSSVLKSGASATLGDMCKIIATYGSVARDYFKIVTN